MAKAKKAPQPAETTESEPLNAAAILAGVAAVLGCLPAEVPTKVLELAPSTSVTPIPDLIPAKKGAKHPTLRWARTQPKAKLSLGTADAAAARIRVYERRHRTWELRKAHMTLDAISKEVGVSMTTVQKDLRWWYDSLAPSQADVEERRAMELDRIDAMSAKVLAAVDVTTLDKEGNVYPLDLDAVKTWLGLRKQYADLAHLTKVAPVVQINVSGDYVDSLIAEVTGTSPVAVPAQGAIEVASRVVSPSLEALLAEVAVDGEAESA